MDQRNGSMPHPVVSQALFDRFNRLAEQFAEVADMAILHLRGEIPPNSPIYVPHSVADDLDQLCEALDHFRAEHSITVPDLEQDSDQREPSG